MNPLTTGKLISHKRKQKNYTQEQLAEKIGVSNKTISKWETGKCMPDYTIIKKLCETLEITMTELIEGKETDEKNIGLYDEQIVSLLKRTQELEKQKNLILGVLLMVMGIALQALSYSIDGSTVKDFFSGILLGISIPEMLIGVYIFGRSICK